MELVWSSPRWPWQRLWCHLVARPRASSPEFGWYSRACLSLLVFQMERAKSPHLLVPFLYCTVCFVCLILKLPLCESVASINNWEDHSVGKPLSLALRTGSSLRLGAEHPERNYAASVRRGYEPRGVAKRQGNNFVTYLIRFIWFFK